MAVMTLLALVSLSGLPSPTSAQENPFADTVWEFSGSVKGQEVNVGPYQSKLVGILMLNKSGWKAAWYEKGGLDGLFSGTGSYTVSNNGKEISLENFPQDYELGEAQLATAKINGARTSLSILWAIDTTKEEEGFQFSEKGTLTAKKRAVGADPADLSGDWNGSISGGIKGSVGFKIDTVVDNENFGIIFMDFNFPFAKDEFARGFHFISGTVPAPDGSGDIELFGHFLLNSKNQLVRGKLLATDENSFLSAEEIKGTYNSKSGKLTLQGQFVQEQCDEEGLKCRVKKLKFNILTTR